MPISKQMCGCPWYAAFFVACRYDNIESLIFGKYKQTTVGLSITQSICISQPVGPSIKPSKAHSNTPHTNVHI